MKHMPLRMCIACRGMFAQSELIRIVRDNQSNDVKLDMDKKLFGRGAYICRKKECIKKAEKKRGIERHLGCIVPKEIYKEAESVVE